MLKLTLSAMLLLLSFATAHAQTRPAGQLLSPVYSSTASGPQSFLRLWIDDGTARQVRVTILNAQTGVTIGTWMSPLLPDHSMRQFPITQIETEAGLTTKPAAYSFYLDTGDIALTRLRWQLVLWSATTGYFQNAPGCNSILNSTHVGDVHTTRLSNYPSTLYITNDRGKTKNLTVVGYDSETGASLGPSVPLGSIAGFGTMIIPERDIEVALAFTPTAAQSHINLEFTLTDPTDLSGFFSLTDQRKVQHVVQNGLDGSTVDMTAYCFPIQYAN